MGQLASLGPGATEAEKAHAERSEKEFRGHKITLRDTGEPAIHAFIGTAGEDESPEFGGDDEESDECESNLNCEKQTVPYSGYKRYE